MLLIGPIEIVSVPFAKVVPVNARLSAVFPVLFTLIVPATDWPCLPERARELSIILALPAALAMYGRHIAAIKKINSVFFILPIVIIQLILLVSS